MDKLVIQGGVPLRGSVRISGSKNAALPIIAAAILTKKPVTLLNVPMLEDVRSMQALLQSMGCTVEFLKDTVSFTHKMLIDCSGLSNLVASYDIVRKMRASILVLGPMLAAYGEANVSMPGGCAIGLRPVDMHLSALEAMGATINIDNGYINAQAPHRLKGAEIFFEKVSVGATENIMTAAVLADGTTTIHNAAREPEVVDLANFLIKLGAKIDGVGSDVLTIEGVKELGGCEHRVIPDRIEAGTFAIAAAASNGKLKLEECEPEHLASITYHLRSAGVVVEEGESEITVYRSDNGLAATTIQTSPYPNFPTDLQAQFMALLTLAPGVSHITETIFENRFMHVSELARMDANISIVDNTAIITGVDKLKPAEVMASDLRASVTLVIAALCASGESTINRIYHIDRGYERIEDKLIACGARIQRM